MAQPLLVDEPLRQRIDELITADGDPFADAVAIMAHTLERALGPASGGMSQGEFELLAKLAFSIVEEGDARIDIPEGR